jgi:uncharacterized protein with HEPN domain
MAVPTATAVGLPDSEHPDRRGELMSAALELGESVGQAAACRADLRMYLQDIADALAELDEDAAGETLPNYLANRQLRRSVERVFEIIGEAMSKMIHRFPESRDRIDHARRIANFRHIIAHEYRNIDDQLAWDIVVHAAPLLQRQIGLWMAELEQ